MVFHPCIFSSAYFLNRFGMLGYYAVIFYKNIKTAKQMELVPLWHRLFCIGTTFYGQCQGWYQMWKDLVLRTCTVYISRTSAKQRSQPFLSGGAKWKNLPDFCILLLIFPLFPNFSLFPWFLAIFWCQGSTLPPWPPQWLCHYICPLP